MVKNKTKNKLLLPKNIRDDLLLTIVLQGNIHLIQDKGRAMKSQHDQMIMFYHGYEPFRSSEIKLLCDGVASYRSMFDSTQSKVTRKSKDE